MGGGRPLRLHLVRPAPLPARTLPVVVWIFGGRWQVGTPESGLPHLTRLARRGYAGAAIEYRYSSEAPFPAQLEDCKCADRFLRANAVRLHLDPDRIGVWGPSADGHLAALLGTTADRAELEGAGGWPGWSSRVQAVCDWYGPTDFLQMDRAGSAIVHDAPDSPESCLIGAPIQARPDLAARANPITYITGDEPPFLIMHGDRDRLVPPHQSELLYVALRAHGVDATLHLIADAGHGGPEFETEAVRQTVEAFFDRVLKRG